MGRYYLVRVAVSSTFVHGFHKGSAIPLLGGEHSDPEIGANYPHTHVDWRFVSTSRFRAISKLKISLNYGLDILVALIIPPRAIGGYETRRMLCKRASLTFPTRQEINGKLEKHYANAVAKCDVCPHRGISLVGAPVVNGARVCPGHGLAWNVETGKMQPRFDIPEAP